MKAHYEVLDGLRGTAALSIIVFHIFELLVPDIEHNPMPHAFLAADFFFALSGFVMGYAYDERLKPGAAPAAALSFWTFAKQRLIRLHPMVIVATVIGLLGYMFDPFVGDAQRVGVAISPGLLLVTFGLTLLLLPSPTLPNCFGETHSMNGPAWTLLQEYIANVLYGLWGAKMKRGMHIALCFVSAAALLWTANHLGNLGYGWSWKYFWVAPIRTACPFLMGLLVYRLGLRVRIPHPYVLLSVVLVAVLIAPVMGVWNGVFEAGCVIVVFPLILMAGAGATRVEGPIGWLCRFTGQLSYPIYIVHYAFIYMFGHWVWSTHPAPALVIPVAVALYAWEVGLATLLLYAYDLPLRAWLARRFLKRPAVAVAHAEPVR